jgi:hypothetical protein
MSLHSSLTARLLDSAQSLPPAPRAGPHPDSHAYGRRPLLIFTAPVEGNQTRPRPPPSLRR